MSMTVSATPNTRLPTTAAKLSSTEPANGRLVTTQGTSQFGVRCGPAAVGLAAAAVKTECSGGGKEGGREGRCSTFRQLLGRPALCL